MKESFGIRLKFLRKQRDLTQEELSKQISIPRDTIANWETGRTEPDIQGLIALADFFGVTLDYLVCRNNIQ